MSKEINFEDFKFPEPERVNIDCDDVNNIFDYMWLFSNIPWCNHSNQIGFIQFDENKTCFIFKDDGAEDLSIDKTEFNKVEITSFHGFAMNYFSFKFYLEDEIVDVAMDLKNVALTEDGFITGVTKQTEAMKKMLQNRIDRLKELTDTVEDEQPR
jgi:hypothetical protein